MIDLPKIAPVHKARLVVGIGIAALGVLLALLAANAAAPQLALSPNLSDSTLWLMGGSVLAWLGGVSIATWRRGEEQGAVSWWLLPIVLLALALRTGELDTLPLGVWYDEALYGIDTRQILEDPLTRPLVKNNATFPHYMLFALGMRLTSTDAITGVRLAQALFGVAAVVMAYFVGRRLRGERFGLLFAFILAVMRWSINFSRIGMTGIEVTFFVLLTFYALHRLTTPIQARSLSPLFGGNGDSLGNALLVGAAIGGGLWFYRAYQLLLLPLLFYGAIAWRWGERWQRTYSVVAIAALTLLIILLPLGQLLVYQPGELFGRVGETSLLRQDLEGRSLLAVLGESVVKHVAMFHLRGDMNGRHNLPGAPMLDIVTGILFIVGIGLALRLIGKREGAREQLFFFALLVVGMGASILSVPDEAPHSLRSIGVVPAVGYFAALAAERVLAWAGRASARRAAVVACALGLPMLALNYDVYFNQQRRDYEAVMSYTTIETLTARYLDALPAAVTVWASPNAALHPQADLITPARLAQVERADAAVALPIRENITQPLVWLVGRDEAIYLGEMQRLYPNATIDTIHATDYGVTLGVDDIDTLFYAVTITPEAIAAQRALDDGGRGLTATYYANSDWSGEPALTRRELFVHRYVFPTPLERPYSVRWQGELYAPMTGDYTMGLRAAAAGWLSIDGQTLLEATDSVACAAAQVTLEIGWHTIEVRHLDTKMFSLIFLEWMPPDGRVFMPIGSEYFRTGDED